MMDIEVVVVVVEEEFEMITESKKVKEEKGKEIS